MFRLLSMAALLAVAAGCGKGSGTKLPEDGTAKPSARIEPPKTQAKMPTTGTEVPVIKLPSVNPSGLSPEEQTIFDQINQARAAEKLPALKADPVLMRLAREQAAKMAKTKQTEGGVSPADLAAAGYFQLSYGSSVGSGQGGDPRQAIDQWVKTGFIRQTATDPNYEDVGIGYARADGAENRYYYTAVFAKRKR